MTSTWYNRGSLPIPDFKDAGFNSVAINTPNTVDSNDILVYNNNNGKIAKIDKSSFNIQGIECARLTNQNIQLLVDEPLQFSLEYSNPNYFTLLNNTTIKVLEDGVYYISASIGVNVEALIGAQPITLQFEILRKNASGNLAFDESYLSYSDDGGAFQPTSAGVSMQALRQLNADDDIEVVYTLTDDISGVVSSITVCILKLSN